MKKPPKKTEAYIQELEEKIIDLSLKLKTNSNLLATEATKHHKLISKLTHNLKNPIGVAYSFSDMILENTASYTPEKLEKHLQIVKESSQFAIELLNSFVTFQQLNSTTCNYNFKLNNYTELLNTVVENLRKKSKKNIEIIVKDLTKEAILLNIDAEKITVALEQILQNAVRFSKENSNITIVIEANNTKVKTKIIDEGIGISKNNISEIFDAFFVVNTYDLDKQKCIGLGLTIAKKILLKHSGDILVESFLNKGTSVKITLPIHK